MDSWLAVVAAIVWIAPVVSRAHPTGLSYLDLDAQGPLLHAKLQLPASDLAVALDLDSNRDGKLEQSDLTPRQQALTEWLGSSLRVMGDGQLCRPEPGNSELHLPLLTVGADFRCAHPPADVDVTADFTEAIGTGFSTFVHLQAGGLTRQGLISSASPSVSLSLVPSGSAWTLANVGRFVLLGMEHIFTGYDHILFLLALLMIGGRLRSIVFIATAFTLAHSITLSLAALGLVHLPSRLVESGIAASIAYVAGENFVHAAPEDREPLVLRWRWLVTFCFGLVHGFGFATALADLGLTRAALPVALACFNIGVEVGQLTIIALAYPAIRYLSRRTWYRPRGVRFASVGVFGIAVYWFAVRAFAG